MGYEHKQQHLSVCLSVFLSVFLAILYRLSVDLAFCESIYLLHIVWFTMFGQLNGSLVNKFNVHSQPIKIKNLMFEIVNFFLSKVLLHFIIYINIPGKPKNVNQFHTELIFAVLKIKVIKI